MRMSTGRILIIGCLAAMLAGGAAPAAEPAAPATWPAHEDGLLFKWSSGNTVAEPALGLNKSGQPIFAYMLRGRGRALLGGNYEMILANGSYHAATLGPFLAQSWIAAGTLSLEAYVTPQDPARVEPGEILSFGAEDGRYAFILLQHRNKLLLGVRTSATEAVAPGALTEVATLADTRPVHLYIAHARGTLSCYLNGELVYAEPLAGEYADWPEDPQLLFGSSWKEERDWGGCLEKVALYRRELSSEEIAAHAAAVAAMVAARPAMERLVVEATLLRRTTARTDIEPYGRALGHYEYRVDRVISGRYEAPVIHVMHWTVMDRQALPIASRPLQQSYTLVLEPFDKQPQLRSELQQDDLEWDYDSPVYYDVDL